MSDVEEKVELLADIFPRLPRSELAVRASSCDRIDVVVENLMSEGQQTQDDTELSKEGTLRQIFPQIPMNKLEKVLKKTGDNLENAVNELTLEKDFINEMSNVTGLTPQDIEPYLQKSEGCLQALVEIMCNHRRKRKVRRSRIQDSRTAGMTKFIEPYKYNSSSKEAIKLKDAVADDVLLQSVNFGFLAKCLEFFEGALDGVIRVAYLFIENNAQSLTFRSDLSYEIPDNNSKVNAADILRTAKPGPIPVFKVALSSKPQDRGISKPKSHSPNTSTPVIPSKIDLHGYTVADAVRLAERAARSWWESESQQRLEYGILHKFGTNAAFVEPLELVTGRGLHSSGGPKVRSSVIKRLVQEDYVLAEETGRVLVVGKKKK